MGDIFRNERLSAEMMDSVNGMESKRWVSLFTVDFFVLAKAHDRQMHCCMAA